MPLWRHSIHVLWELRVSSLCIGYSVKCCSQPDTEASSAPANSELMGWSVAGDASECVLRCGVRLDLRQGLHGVVSSISSQQWDLSQPPMQQSR